MNRDPFSGSLRAGLEAWEREAAAQWNAMIRSPGVLHRVGGQIAQTLETHQRVSAALGEVAQRAALAQAQTVHTLALLEQLEAQINTLAARLDRLERMLNDAGHGDE